MKKFKKLTSVLLVLALSGAVLSGCKGSEETGKEVEPTQAAPTKAADPTKAPDPTATPTPAPTEAPARDLGGMTITIGNWWSNSDDFEAKTTYDEDLVAYRNEIQKKYNCTIKEIKVCEWNEMQELCASAIMAGTPDCSVYTLDTRFVAPLVGQNLFYDLNTLPSYHGDDTKYNSLIKEALTFEGKTYGMATAYEPRAGIFFNKRLFTEAGVDPELPYNLQKEGNWTWDALEDLSKKLTRDIDSDGVVDVYAFATMHADFMSAAVFSNDARYIGKNEQGLFYNATNEPNFLEALQFSRKLFDEGYVMQQPADTEWNWFEAAFHDGKGAMRVCDEYVKGQLADMEDDWGFVMFPAGPHGVMTSAYMDNVFCIPACFTPEEADNIMFAYDLWTNPVPGYEDDESWKLAAYPAYRDERAVDETLTRMRSGADGVMHLEAFTGIELGDIVWHIWDQSTTPAEVIESVQQTWDSKVDDTNIAFKLK